MIRNLLYTLPVFAAALLTGCITPYDPPVAGGHDNLLVVEGIITDGETVIRLSNSFDLIPEYDKDGYILPGYGFSAVSGATVSVEGENGDMFRATETGSGEYTVYDVALLDDVRYRLRISYFGEEYESQYRYPQPTPPFKIDFHNKDGNLQVRLDVTGEPDGPNHYYWSYEETWEVQARRSATHYYGTGPYYYGDPYFIYYSYGDAMGNPNINLYPYPNLKSPYSECWSSRSSMELLLGSTERLKENTLRSHVLYEFADSDNRISKLYHTKITQYAIGEDAYYYFDNQKSNTDETGSIFAPIPSELWGNIVCTSSPDTPVIGFVEFSHRVQRQAYLTSTEAQYAAPFVLCPIIVEFDENDSPWEYYPVTSDPGMTTRDCIDCRIIGGQTTRRPEWWLNDRP